jgi:hypothetical protein
MPTVPGQSHNANAASLSDWASELITLLFDQFEAQWKLETKHSTATTTPSTHSSTAHDSVKLLDSTQAGLSWHREPPHLSQPLTTISDLHPRLALDLQAELDYLRCISDANDDHAQANPIDNYFPRLRDG